jgi:hypothetical protein
MSKVSVFIKKIAKFNLSKVLFEIILTIKSLEKKLKSSKTFIANKQLYKYIWERILLLCSFQKIRINKYLAKYRRPINSKTIIPNDRR